jgi:hypothetical protein
MAVTLPEHEEIGRMVASLLSSPHCPPTLRAALKNHLAELYNEADLTQPEIVRLIYAHLVAPSKRAADEDLLSSLLEGGQTADTGEQPALAGASPNGSGQEQA